MLVGGRPVTVRRIEDHSPSQIRCESTSYSGSAARPLPSAILDNDFSLLWRDFCSLD